MRWMASSMVMGSVVIAAGSSGWRARNPLRGVQPALGDGLLRVDERQCDHGGLMPRLARQALHLDAFAGGGVLDLQHGQPDVFHQRGGEYERRGPADHGPPFVDRPGSFKFMLGPLAFDLGSPQLAREAVPADPLQRFFADEPLLGLDLPL